MNFGIGDQASGLMGLLIFGGAIALVVTLLVLLLFRRAGARGEPADHPHVVDGDDILP